MFGGRGGWSYVKMVLVARRRPYTSLGREGLPAFKIGGRWCFARSAVLAWIAPRNEGARGRATAHPPAGRERTHRAEQ